MLRKVPPRKSGPLSTWERTTSRNSVQCNRSVLRRRKQPPRREARKVPSVSENYIDGFVCAWCGNFRPWSQMEGFDRRLKFCDRCVRVMDALEIGLATATTTNVGRRGA